MLTETGSILQTGAVRFIDDWWFNVNPASYRAFLVGYNLQVSYINHNAAKSFSLLHFSLLVQEFFNLQFFGVFLRTTNTIIIKMEIQRTTFLNKSKN